MKVLWFIAAVLLLSSSAMAENRAYPVSAWTVREVYTYAEPKEEALDGGMIANSGQVTWLDVQGKWAHIEIQGEECYVPADALTTDRVFDFACCPTRSGHWPYEGEVRFSPDGKLHIEIRMAEEYVSGLIFGGAKLCGFEVIEEETGDLICTAEPDFRCDPVVFVGEGVCG